MTPLDHLLALLLAIGFPIYAMASTPATKRAVEAGQTARRTRDYWLTLFELWFQGLAVLGLWAQTGRSWPELGLARPGGWRFWVLAVLLVGAAVVVLLQLRAVRVSQPTRHQLRERMGRIAFFLPQTRPELRLFSVLSVSAGVCEEIAYRGFMIWYFLRLWVGVGTWTGTAIAVALSSVAFGFAHFYLGWRDAIRSGITGAVLAGIYLASETLWLAMAFHALIDLNSGFLGWLAFKPQD